MENPVETIAENLQSISKSWTLKIISLIIIALLLGIPTFWIDDLVRERTAYFESARSSVEKMWGQEQTVGTPILGVPYSYSCGTKKKPQMCRSVRYQYPETLKADFEIQTKSRVKGIYEIPLYTTQAQIDFQFKLPEFKDLKSNSQVHWDEAQVHFQLATTQGLLSSPQLSWGQSVHNMKIHTGSEAPYHGGMSVAEPGMKAWVESGESFSIQLDFNGSRNLSMTPLAGENTIQMNSDWPHPEFLGAQLPIQREVSDQGFQSTWKISEMNHMVPRTFTGTKSTPSEVMVGFRQFVPVSHYTQLDRAIKYAKLFVVFTFLFCFFSEVKSGRQIHFIQYLLVGSSLLVFFVMLLSLSEHFGFAVAYWVASAAVVVQLGVFLWKVLRPSRSAKFAPLMILGLYGFLFGILQSEDYALLTGSLGLFVILSLVMFISSKMNWSGGSEK